MATATSRSGTNGGFLEKGWLRAAAGLLVESLLVSGCSYLENWGPSLAGRPEQPPQVAAEPVTTRDVSWRGWSAIEQTNGLIALRHVPAAGGRTLSLEINGDDAFLVFPDQQGKTYPADSRDNSIHFGGHYACIGPERIWNVHEQPFNFHAGPYRVSRLTHDDDRHELRFTSRPGTWKAATVSADRKITMYRGTTHVVVDETVTNRGPDPLEFYIWDFTQIDAVNHRRPGEPLRRLSFYLPVPTEGDKKQYHSFLPAEAKMTAQFDESLPADVLAIHYQAVQFKLASHAATWWVAAVDHDTGWTYVKAFDPAPQARYVDNNGPIEVYGAGRHEPGRGSFVEMELLTGIGRYPPGQGIQQREHWYATVCKGPVLALTKAGVICEKMTLSRDKDYFDLAGRFGVFHLGTAQLEVLDRAGETLFADEPIVIDPRKEFVLERTMPAKEGADAVVLKVFDYRQREVGRLAQVEVQAASGTPRADRAPHDKTGATRRPPPQTRPAIP